MPYEHKLTLTALKYVCINRGEHFFQFNPYSTGIDFSRQNLTSVDILTSTVDPRTVRVTIFTMTVDL